MLDVLGQEKYDHFFDKVSNYDPLLLGTPADKDSSSSSNTSSPTKTPNYTPHSG